MKYLAVDEMRVNKPGINPYQCDVRKWFMAMAGILTCNMIVSTTVCHNKCDSRKANGRGSSTTWGTLCITKWESYQSSYYKHKDIILVLKYSHWRSIILTRAKPSLLKSCSENLERKNAMDSSRRDESSTAHTHGPRGSRKPQGSTSGLPRPARTLTVTKNIGQVKSTAS